MKNESNSTLLLTVLTFAAILFSSLEAQAQTNRQLEQEKSENREKRVALVIGNGDYAIARKLTNPVNDASDVANSLAALGFEVIAGTDLNLKTMKEKVREFGDKLRANGGVGLFYYAGHGIQVGGRNYLIPIEADIQREDEIEDTALNFDLVLRKMATANNGLNIVVLDACRNNPFARSWSRSADEGGLAQISAPTGTFIAYATSPDRTASDGTGRNGLYTAELLKYIRQPNVKIEEAFKQITIAVDRASGGKQVPWTSSSLRGEFYFKPDGIIAKTPPPVIESNTGETVSKPPTVNAATAELEAWNKIKDSPKPEDYAGFLNQYPNGIFAAQAKSKLVGLYGGNAGGERSTPMNPYDFLANKSDAAIFYLDGENRVSLKIASTKQDYNTGGGARMLGIGGGFKQTDTLNGGRSQTRVKTSKPEFEYSTSANVNLADVVFVVKLKPKSDKREIQTMQKNFSGYKKEDLVTATFEEVSIVGKKKVYKIKFANPLAAGEYAVVVKEPFGQEMGIYASNVNLPGVYFDFGVDADK